MKYHTSKSELSVWFIQVSTYTIKNKKDSEYRHNYLSASPHPVEKMTEYDFFR